MTHLQTQGNQGAAVEIMDVTQLKQRLIDEVEANKDELFELCSSLIKIPSENPPGDSTEISQFIADYLKKYDIDVEWHESADKMYNLVSSIGDSEKGKTFNLLWTH